MPASAVPVSPVWRAIFRLRLVRRVLGIPEENGALASAAHAPGRLGSSAFDWEGPDTSLTQAELEVLK
ncbi:MAG TPA: hypothetical protein VFI53_04365 [Myxococcaceae bacterium]|nr:hypothetical protein [Myxococcaceae bacterium]